MPTREEMQGLAQEIVRAYEDRVAGIAQLRVAVKTQLKELDDAHNAMSTQLRADLAKGEEERLREARALKQDLVRGVAERKSAVSARLKEMDAAHAAMARELRTELAKVRPALAEEEKRRQNQAREFRSELGKAVAEGKAAVKTQLKELDDAHNAMSTQLRADLAKGEAERRSDARIMREGLEDTTAQRRSDVSAIRRGFREEQGGARDEWQKLSSTMQAKRGVPVVEVKPPEAVAPPPVEEVAPPPPVEEVAEEEAVARAEVAEVTPEMAELRDRVFAYLADHPDGTRMTELEQEFGLARIQMARVIRSLMDDNKVEKRDLLYFAI